MTARERRIGSLASGAGGTLLIASLFMPWAGRSGGEASGWEFLLIGDVLLLLTGLIAIVAALTGGRWGVFRPDVSLIGAADLLGVVSSLTLGWLIVAGFPEAADREVGLFLALTGALVVAFGAADYGTLRGDPVFPRLDDDRRS